VRSPLAAQCAKVLIDRAEREIDMAAYVLTDWPVMQALTRAADRGVKVRIYLDGTQLAEREPAKVFNDLAETPGVEIRIKHENSAPMHLKSYEIDGRMLRTGAVNFSASGLIPAAQKPDSWGIPKLPWI
jgi:phosphatidylserine/phosphatidylglycerophosphate/cardiolipin synthase-like enzyme